jgi:hypothetical protein
MFIAKKQSYSPPPPPALPLISVNVNALAASFLLGYSVVPRIRLYVVAEQLLLTPVISVLTARRRTFCSLQFETAPV